ncbi:hypothetical protein PFICI_04062 [Pestalotiopsis fici W106-1]|uniref:Uncharacterized protein n=1 Tax=Pestalotiopsis fici (strain W106-1 / CGMCC3.15140) TaxID=1229662 RepID=W3XKP4_PESFW|nr:uncharacterized protein PFICI_04062 [Pestalotiopsis fici W106-1]ETS86037.1 hypothetical protein PFICI_04062 [Pestalotiopsis fici W106-1]
MSDLDGTMSNLPNVYPTEGPIAPKAMNSMWWFFRNKGELEAYHLILQQISHNLRHLGELAAIAQKRLKECSPADPTTEAVVKAISIDVTKAMQIDQSKYDKMRDMELSDSGSQHFEDLPQHTRDAWITEYVMALRHRENLEKYTEEWMKWLVRKPVSHSTPRPPSRMDYADAEAACMANWSDETEGKIFEMLNDKINSSQSKVWNLYKTTGRIEYNPSAGREARDWRRRIASIYKRGFWKIRYGDDVQKQTKFKDLSTATQRRWIEDYMTADAIVDEVDGIVGEWLNLTLQLNGPPLSPPR